MAWHGEMSTILRYLLNDIDSTNYTYSDDQIETSLLVAAQFVQLDIEFGTTYTVDAEACTLSPDPTNSTPKDNAFMNLVCYKAACIILTGEARSQAACAVRVVDGPSSIDMGGAAASIKVMQQEVCETYEKLKLAYKMGGAGSTVDSLGKAVMSPFSPGSDFSGKPNSTRRIQGWFQ